MNERIVLGVTGSIAAYKSCYLLRRLRARGFRVEVILTPEAQRFVGRVSFEALTSEGVYDDLWARRESLTHISLLEGTKLVLVAPATANIIAKAAQGLADDLLSCLLLAADPGRLIFAPAMNQGMWFNPATRENIRILKSRGARFVEPAEGELACGVEGMGRLAPLEEILLAAEGMVRSHRLLSGKKVVVTAGRTEEELDPVRVLTNRSSGMMGVELAKGFARKGGKVTLLAGKVSIPLPSGIKVERAFSAEDMLERLEILTRDADVLVMAAAVGDYAPKSTSAKKIKAKEINLELKKTPDVLTSLGESSMVRIGFSLETGKDWVENADAKMKSKGLDAVVANPVRNVASPDAEAEIIFSDGRSLKIPRVGKQEFAERIVQAVIGILETRGKDG